MPYGTLAVDSITPTSNLAITGNMTVSGNVTPTGIIFNSSGRPMLNQTGGILQVVQTTKLDSFSTTSTSFVDLTGMSVTITPSSSSSRILLFVYMWAGQSGYNSVQVNLLRGSTNIFQPSSGSYPATSFATITASNDAAICSFMYVDSPATTSSTTYKLQCRTNAGTLSFNVRGDSGSTTPASFIAMEIAG